MSVLARSIRIEVDIPKGWVVLEPGEATCSGDKFLRDGLMHHKQNTYIGGAKWMTVSKDFKMKVPVNPNVVYIRKKGARLAGMQVYLETCLEDPDCILFAVGEEFSLLITKGELQDLAAIITQYLEDQNGD